jgi:hypothetical protein
MDELSSTAIAVGAVMDGIEGKLATWMERYERLKEARSRLKKATAGPRPVPKGLKAEVELLQHRCNEALDELNAEYARLKKDPPPPHGRT